MIIITNVNIHINGSSANIQHEAQTE